MDGYIKKIRDKVGSDKVIFNFAVGIIVDNNGRVLLQKRNNFGDWGFPGGALEFGESLEEALLREVKEETGIDISIDRFFGIYSKYFAKYANGDESQTIVGVFICTPKSNDLFVDNKETFELRYFDKNDIPRLFNKQHRDIWIDYIDGRENICR